MSAAVLNICRLRTAWWARCLVGEALSCMTEGLVVWRGRLLSSLEPVV